MNFQHLRPATSLKVVVKSNMIACEKCIEFSPLVVETMKVKNDPNSRVVPASLIHALSDYSLNYFASDKAPKSYVENAALFDFLAVKFPHYGTLALKDKIALSLIIHNYYGSGLIKKSTITFDIMHISRISIPECVFVSENYRLLMIAALAINPFVPKVLGNKKVKKNHPAPPPEAAE